MGGQDLFALPTQYKDSVIWCCCFKTDFKNDEQRVVTKEDHVSRDIGIGEIK
jgi:hypothetical protein